MWQTVAEVKNSEISVCGRDAALDWVVETAEKKTWFERAAGSALVSGSHLFHHLPPAVEVAGTLPAVAVAGRLPAVEIAGKLKDC